MMWTDAWKPVVFAFVAPLALVACAIPTTRMPPTAPVAMPIPPAAPAAPLQTPSSIPTLPAAGPGGQVPALPGAMPAPALPAMDGPAPAAARGIAGLTERQPDLCGAKQQTAAIGKPASVIPTLGLTRSYRVVEYRGIEPQDYVPDRMVFRLDPAGNITNIDCG